MMHRYSAVLFDFDGTLADTAKDVWDSVRYGFGKNGLSIPDNYAADDRNLAKLNEQIVAELYPGSPEALGRQVAADVAHHYRNLNTYPRTQLYPYIKELLSALRAAQIPTGILSNKSHTSLGRILKEKGWLDYFDSYRGTLDSDNDTLGKVDRLRNYMAAFDTSDAVYIGDSAGDVEAAKANGLYVIGAVSSLGKTAFCMQMADQLARQGRDVLVFSLEMMAWELMARSISRESFLLDTSARRRMAKTARGVLDGRRWSQYTTQEKAHLDAARDAYAAYAGHIYFREGDHETGLDYIQSEVARHIAETGEKPVVLIDYLQIIAPVDVHFTDKQNLDRIVCALKKMSRQYELTVFAISSFNRENYNLEVSMNAFKESGGIDYSADVLLGLQARGAGRPGFQIDEEKRKDPRELELKILKNRSAALGQPISLRYYPAFSCFMEG